MNKALFKITTEDAQNTAMQRIGRKLTFDELYQVQRGIEFGLENCWGEVVAAAVDEIDS